MVNIAEPGKLPLSEQQLNEVADHFQVQFPSDFRQFMLEYNGGVVDSPSGFVCQNGQQEHIAWFYSIDVNSESDIRSANELRAGRLPQNFVSIGYDGGGNEICLDCNSGQGYGSVYFWDHDFEADQENGMTPEEADNYSLIAENFTAFLNSLFQLPPPPDSVQVIDNSTDEDKERLRTLMEQKGVE